MKTGLGLFGISDSKIIGFGIHFFFFFVIILIVNWNQIRSLVFDLELNRVNIRICAGFEPRNWIQNYFKMAWFYDHLNLQ